MITYSDGAWYVLNSMTIEFNGYWI